MPIIKCKMCGGDLVIKPESTVAECEYCGSRQTVPTADNEKKLTLFARANRLRSACEFDKAAGIYEMYPLNYRGSRINLHPYPYVYIMWKKEFFTLFKRVCSDSNLHHCWN